MGGEIAWSNEGTSRGGTAGACFRVCVAIAGTHERGARLRFDAARHFTIRVFMMTVQVEKPIGPR
jgi:hypothetical protein